MKKITITILIFVLMAIGLELYHLFFQKPETITSQSIHTDTTYLKGDDSLIYVPEPYPVHDIVEVPAKFDTLEALRDYYTKRFQPDTLVDDSALFVAIYDTLYKNGISSRKKVIKRTYPIITTTITNTNVIENKGLYLGGGFGYGSGILFTGGVSYLINNQMFSIDLTTNKEIFFTYKRKF
jgi:hypothetical protein